MEKQKGIKTLQLVILVFLLTTALAGCREKAATDSVYDETNADEDSLVIAMINEPTSFDPFFADSADTRSILFNIFEGLVKPTKDGELMPAVAESFETSDDSKTYTFILRNDIKFHNGNLVTMDDVIYSVNQAIDTKVAGYDNIMSVEAMDEKTIKRSR